MVAEGREVLVDFFRAHIRYQPLDSINLIFAGRRDASGLLQRVLQVFDSEGWSRDEQEHQYMLEHDDRFRYESDWRTRGPFWRRYHVRFWRGDDVILASAHKERFTKWRWLPLPWHEVESFDEAKEEVENIFRNRGWNVQHDARPQSLPIEDPPASGSASLIATP